MRRIGSEWWSAEIRRVVARKKGFLAWKKTRTQDIWRNVEE